MKHGFRGSARFNSCTLRPKLQKVHLDTLFFQKSVFKWSKIVIFALPRVVGGTQKPLNLHLKHGFGDSDPGHSGRLRPKRQKVPLDTLLRRKSVFKWFKIMILAPSSGLRGAQKPLNLHCKTWFSRLGSRTLRQAPSKTPKSASRHTVAQKKCVQMVQNHDSRTLERAGRSPKTFKFAL